MLINLGDSYSLECRIVEGRPSIKLVGECYKVNYSDPSNTEFSYINHGSFRGFFINSSKRIVFKNYVEENISDNETLVVIPSNKGLLYVLFDLKSGEVAYSLKE